MREWLIININNDLTQSLLWSSFFCFFNRFFYSYYLSVLLVNGFLFSTFTTFSPLNVFYLPDNTEIITVSSNGSKRYPDRILTSLIGPLWLMFGNLHCPYCNTAARHAYVSCAVSSQQYKQQMGGSTAKFPSMSRQMNRQDRLQRVSLQVNMCRRSRVSRVVRFKITNMAEHKWRYCIVKYRSVINKYQCL